MNQELTTIGRYKVVGKLGQGAMGRVYLAEDPSLKRNVAIKVMHRWTGDQADLLARFQREAEISAQLNHPNVITIFDVGEEDAVGPFLAMEHVEGQSLQEMLEQAPLEPDRAMPILAQTALALEAAHTNGIIHRDLKPANLLVDKNDRVKLMDFGISRREECSCSSSGLLCTPFYAAPELLADETSSAAVDRWAFAVSAYQCLTRSLPFDNKSMSALLYAVAHEEPHLTESMSPEVQAVFLRALAKDPSKRYPDLRSFMVDLLNYVPLNGETRMLCFSMLAVSTAMGNPNQLTVKLIKEKRTRTFRKKALVLMASMVAVLAMVMLILGARGLSIRELSVDSNPPGARVTMDGRLLGETPLKVQRMDASPCLLRIEKEGFLPWERQLNPQDKNITIFLETKPFTVHLASDPPGAEVILNSRIRGITPITDLEVPGEGTHKLLIRKPGYEPWMMWLSNGGKPPEMVQLRKHSMGYDTVTNLINSSEPKEEDSALGKLHDLSTNTRVDKGPG